MTETEKLKAEQKRLKKEINKNLDLLIGHIRQSPSMKNPSMTLKKDGKTVSRYIRKPILDKARQMTANHVRVRELIHELSEVNWELLTLEGRQQ